MASLEIERCVFFWTTTPRMTQEVLIQKHKSAHLVFYLYWHLYTNSKTDGTKVLHGSFKSYATALETSFNANPIQTATECICSPIYPEFGKVTFNVGGFNFS